MRSFSALKKQLLKDVKIQAAYQALGPEFALVEMLIKKRLAKGLTQSELAQKIGTQQSAVARLESGRYNPTIQFLAKVARALDAHIKVSIY